MYSSKVIIENSLLILFSMYVASWLDQLNMWFVLEFYLDYTKTPFIFLPPTRSLILPMMHLTFVFINRQNYFQILRHYELLFLYILPPSIIVKLSLFNHYFANFLTFRTSPLFLVANWSLSLQNISNLTRNIWDWRLYNVPFYYV